MLFRQLWNCLPSSGLLRRGHIFNTPNHSVPRLRATLQSRDCGCSARCRQAVFTMRQRSLCSWSASCCHPRHLPPRSPRTEPPPPSSTAPVDLRLARMAMVVLSSPAWDRWKRSTAGRTASGGNWRRSERSTVVAARRVHAGILEPAEHRILGADALARLQIAELVRRT